MNVGFCLWLARRARRGRSRRAHGSGTVHGVQLALASHSAMAAVHRLMTMLCSASVRRAWIAIPAWEACLRPYALGRAVPMPWLPIPGCVPAALPADLASLRARLAPDQAAARRPLRLARRGGGAAARRLPAVDHAGALPSGAGAARRGRTFVSRRAGGAVSRLGAAGARRRLSRRCRARRAPRRLRRAGAAVSGRRHVAAHERDGEPVAGPRRRDDRRPPHRAALAGERRGGAGRRARCRRRGRGRRASAGQCGRPRAARRARPATLRRDVFRGARREYPTRADVRAA